MSLIGTWRQRRAQWRRMNHAMEQLAKPHDMVDGEIEPIPGYPCWAEWLKKTGSEWPAQ